MKNLSAFPAASILPFAWAVLLVTTAHAQLVSDGATNTLVNVTNNITGNLIVGTNGSFTLLVLSNNSLVTSTLNSTIGQNATARSNEVWLVSPTARLQPGTTLYVGSNGPFNRLVISNGAQVIANFAGNSGIIGNAAGSVSNFALVAGAGSLWTNGGQFNIGYSGAGNQLVVGNGGRVHGVSTYVGLLGSSTNNRVTVTGAGSLWSAGSLNFGVNGTGNRLAVLDGGGVLADVGEINGGSIADLTGPGSFWTNTGVFQVGSGSAGNQLAVSNGAVVTAGTYGSVGGSGSGASFNIATVTDPGSVWAINGDLYVGRDGPWNRLSVNNGGLVAATNLFVGFQPTATSNRMVVAGGTLRVTNANGTGVLDVRRGTNVLNAGLVDADLLIVTNGTSRFELLGGTLITRGASLTTLNNGSGMNVGQSGGGSAFWDVRPGLSNHFVAGNLYIGNASSSNQLLVSTGARLTNGNLGYIGSGTGANGNSSTITGAGSRWEMPNILFLGYDGAFNRLTVDGGGWVASGAGSIGNFETASNNLAVVSGAGSTWSNRFYLSVGEESAGNQLQVADGGQVVCDSVRIGRFATSSGNTATITGNGSEWRVATTFEVGTVGSYNQALVSGGATVRAASLHLSATVSSSSNLVVVTGSGSLWTNQQGVIVGNFGPGNQLVVSNGGMLLSAARSQIGSEITAPNNVATVTGPGSVWSSGELQVGVFGSGNRLQVEAGGRVNCTDGSLGHGTGANNFALVTGAGSLWSNSANLRVGEFSGNNSMIVSNGGTVVASNVFVGLDPVAINNRVVVDGGTLRVTNAAGLSVLEIRRGTNVLNSGLIEADILRMTNGIVCRMEFNGGTLSIRSSRINAGNPINIGNGVSPATLLLAGNGTHDLTGTLGLIVKSNATLTGSGTIVGTTTVSSGGTLSPGDGAATLSFNNAPSLNGQVLMQVFKIGATRFNNRIQVAGTLTYAASLTVNNVGATAFSAGDHFKLFHAVAYLGSFTSITLPPLNPALAWTNKLSVDGSIEVVSVGVSPPAFTGVTLSGTNLIFSGTNGTAGQNYAVLTATNVTTPVINWQSLVTNQFGTGGSFSFTNPIVPGEPQRYFRLRTP